MSHLRFPENTLPVCSVNGSIREILLFCKCPVSENPALTGLRFSGLIEALGPEVQIYILVQLPHGTGIKTLPQPASNVHLIPVNPDEVTIIHSLTSWTQDVILGFEDAQHKALLLYDASRLDAQVMDVLKQAVRDITLSPHHFPNFAGGNLLPVCDGEKSFVIAGADILRNENAEINQAGLIAALEEMFSRSAIIWAGLDEQSGMLNGKQPLFHIDLYLCPLGRLAAVPHLQHILVAELKPEYCLCGQNEATRNLALALDKTAQWFAAGIQGIEFQVIRVPLLIFDQELRHFGSYANAFAENNQGKCRLILPDYTPHNPQPAVNHAFAAKIQAVQQQLGNKLKAAGIESITFATDNYFELSQHEGSLHCSAKALSRKVL
ncbi:MAG: hypothetical protein MUC87_16060 [Bacteroidia bacterium]|jgi:hypothetical protein|nr:hypothetical protein [Bacteroidia bacterium]